MAAVVKHARIESVSSPVPSSQGKYLQTAGRKQSVMADTLKALKSDNKSSASKSEDSKLSDLLARRRSTFKGNTASMMTMRRMTKGSLDKDLVAAAAAAAAAAKPKVKMENTYQTSPKEDQKFSSCKADAAIREVLNTHLNGQSYNAVKAPTQASMLSEQVKLAVKHLHCERHKLVSNVVLGPVREQGMVVASRCVWDSSSDSSSSVTFNNGKIFAIASVFAVYYE